MKSAHAYEMYSKTEQMNTKLIKVIFWFVVFTLLCMFLVTGLLPISYLLFGFPLPQSWYLSMPAK